MMKSEAIDQESRAGATCQKCLFLGIKQSHFTDNNQEFHESLHKRHAQVLLFGFENLQSVESRKEKDDDLIQDVTDNDEDRDRIHKESDIQRIEDVQCEIVANQYPAPTKDVVGIHSEPELQKKVAPWNSKINNQVRLSGFMKNFDASTMQLMRKRIEQCRQKIPQHHGFKCQVCFTNIEQNNQHSESWYGLIDHARSHTGKLYFRCSLCSYESVTKRQMYKHKYRRHNSCTDANCAIIERKMEREDVEKLRLAMMLCVGCKRSDIPAVGNREENGVGKTTELQSGIRSESMTGDVEMNSSPDDVNVNNRHRCILKNQRRFLCRLLIEQKVGANGRSICQVCMEQNIQTTFGGQGAYGHVLDHAYLPIYKCNICSISTQTRSAINQHLNSKHHKSATNNYTNKCDEFHHEIVAWITKCFGSFENRA